MIVVWRVTQQCNLICPFCAYDRDLPWPRHEASPDHLLRFGAVLAEYRRLTGDQVLVSWMGGEPFLWAPLAEMTVRFRRRYGLKVSATTNGSTLDSPAVRDHILQHYAELTVSVDGIGAVHDELRGWLGGFAVLRDGVALLAGEKHAAGHGPRLRANVILMRDSISGFRRLCLELADWGIEEITFNQLGGNDRPEFHLTQRLLPQQAERFAAELPALRRRLAGRGVQLNGGGGYLCRIRASTRGERIPIDDCGPGERFLFIDEQGRVAPCSFTTQGYGISLEDIPSAEALQRLPHRFAKVRRRQRLVPCDDCHSTQVFEKFTT